jgi:hypothetical protein
LSWGHVPQGFENNNLFWRYAHLNCIQFSPLCDCESVNGIEYSSFVSDTPLTFNIGWYDTSCCTITS